MNTRGSSPTIFSLPYKRSRNQRRLIGIALLSLVLSTGVSSAIVPHVLASSPLWKREVETGLSLPQLLQLGIQGYQDRHLRVFGELGILFLPLGERGALVYGIQGGLRWFPDKKKFYFSAGIGYQRLSVRTTLSSLRVENEVLADSATLRLASVFVIPAIGYCWILSDTFSVTSEFGLQVPLLAFGDLFLEKYSTGENSSNSTSLRTDAQNRISRISALPLPELTLLRFSWAL